MHSLRGTPAFSNQNVDRSQPKAAATRTQLPVPARKMAKPESFKTVMCKGWLEMGGCGFGQNCRFAHGEEELRPSKIPIDNPKYKTKLCDKYTKTGVCPYGGRCLFIHPNVTNSDGIIANPYIHPDRMSQLLKERALSTIPTNCARDPPQTPLSSRVTTRVQPWPTKPLNSAKASKMDSGFSDTSFSLSTPSSCINPTPDAPRHLSALGDITNFNTFDSISSQISPDLPTDVKESPDSGTECDADVGWWWSPQMSDPFDLAIASDNIARSLATGFTKDL